MIRIISAEKWNITMDAVDVCIEACYYFVKRETRGIKVICIGGRHENFGVSKYWLISVTSFP